MDSERLLFYGQEQQWKVRQTGFQKALDSMASVLVKLQPRGQMVIPRSLRDQVGVSAGTLLKVAIVKGGQFLITPQASSDGSSIAPRAKDRKQTFQDLREVVNELRQEAKAKGIDKMSKAEINRAVAAARRDLEKAANHSVK